MSYSMTGVKVQYAVDEIDDKHNSRLSVTPTNLTIDAANNVALTMWRQGKHAQVLAWTPEDGYTIVANYGG